MALGANAGSDNKPSHAATRRISVVLESLPLTSLCVAETFPFRRASPISDSNQAPVPRYFASLVFNTQQKATELWSVNQTYMEISPFCYVGALGNYWTCRKQGVIRQYSSCDTRLVYSCKQSDNRATTIRKETKVNRSPFSDLDMWCFLEDVQPILLTFTLKHTATNIQHTVEIVTNTWQRSYS